MIVGRCQIDTVILSNPHRKMVATNGSDMNPARVRKKVVQRNIPATRREWEVFHNDA